MKYFIKIVWLICLCAAGAAAQDNQQWIIKKYVEAPRDIVLQVTPFQPNCPIKFEDVRFLYALEGGFSNSYRLRNIGTKPIRSVTVSSTTGAVNTYARNDGGVLIMPGELKPEPPTCCVKEEIVPLTDELREKFNFKNEIHAIVVLMITEVVFMDGTKYSDETVFDKAQEYLNRLGDAASKQKQQEAKKP